MVEDYIATIIGPATQAQICDFEPTLMPPQYWFAMSCLSREGKREWTYRGPFKPEVIHEFAERGKIWASLLKRLLLSF